MRKHRIGMVGGGRGGFIGAVHRLAMRLDGRFELVSGALSSDPSCARESSAELGLKRSYESFDEMARTEPTLEDGIEAVSIVTPNHLHFEAAKTFLEAGIHVICEKPLTATLAEAIELEALVAKSTAQLFVTHTYAGYQMVREARRLVSEGKIGRVRHIQVEYAQDWLAEESGGKQAEWRTDPKRSGLGGAIADIGTHAAQIARFISGLEIEAVCADLTRFVAGRQLDGHASLLLRFSGGAKGMLWASQVAIGSENELSIRVIGETGSLEWSQRELNTLRYCPLRGAPQLLTRGGPGFRGEVRAPSGHPEGFIEAFSTLYSDAADTIESGRPGPNLPGIRDGIAGMQFIEACVKSSAQGSVWQAL